MIPHRSEQNSYSVWIHLMVRIHSEWYRAISRSVRMIPCHYGLSPNDSVAHSNGLDSEWFENRFRIHTESHGIIFIPNESETCIREDRGRGGTRTMGRIKLERWCEIANVTSQGESRYVERKEEWRKETAGRETK